MSEMKIVKIWGKLKEDTNQSAREFKLIAKQIIFLINKVKYQVWSSIFQNDDED